MKNLILTLPTFYKKAILNLDYNGLSKNECVTLNWILLHQKVIFSDVVNYSDSYKGNFDNNECDVMDFTFKLE